MLCVKNHYRRSHCPKMLACSKCGAKRFSVVADLKTHEKHCGKDRWVCSCGTTFSRKDKLMGHLALFVGHAPAATGAVMPGDEMMPAGALLAAEQQDVERAMGERQMMPPPAAPGRKGEGEKRRAAEEAREVSSCSSAGEVGENDMRGVSLLLRDCNSSNLNLNHASTNLQVGAHCVLGMNST